MTLFSSAKMAARVAAAMACLTASAFAQGAWPQRPVHFVVAFAPAGPADVVGRIVGQALQDAWKQSVVVENRGGGGGNIGASVVARAEADGYTVLVTTSAFPVNLTLYDNPGYALADFHAAAVAATTPNVLARAANLKQTTLPEIIEAAKTQNFSYASAGVGTTTQLAGELIFKILAKVDVRHVPFTGAAPAVTALMSGQVQLAMLTQSSVGELVRTGAIKAVAVAAEHRVPGMPDVPTVKETGVGDIVASTDIYFLMPARTPLAVVEKFNADLNAIIDSGGLDAAFASAGVSPVRLNQAGADAYLAGEAKKWGGVIKAAGVKAE